MWSPSLPMKAVSGLVLALATVMMLIALQLIGRAGHANVVPVSPAKHVEPGPIDHDDDDTGVVFAFTLRTCLGFVGTTLVAAVAGSAGIGDGAFYVPLFYVVSGFSLKAATGLSQAAIAGGSLISMLFNLGMRHPWDPGRPLVDLDLALVLTPALLLGVSLGVLLNDMLPTWVVLVLLVALLAYACKTATLRGLTALAEERQKRAAAHAAEAIRSGPVPRLAPISISHVPSSTWPQRIQVVISREASRAQIAGDSSEDEDAGGGGGTGATSAAPPVGPGAGPGPDGAAAAAAAPVPPAARLGAGPQCAAGVQRAGIGHLATVPSGDSEAFGPGVDCEGAEKPAAAALNSGGALSPCGGLGDGGGGGGGGGGGSGGSSSGSPVSPVRLRRAPSSNGGSSGSSGGGGRDFFSAAMEQEGVRMDWRGDGPFATAAAQQREAWGEKQENPQEREEEEQQQQQQVRWEEQEPSEDGGGRFVKGDWVDTEAAAGPCPPLALALADPCGAAPAAPPGAPLPAARPCGAPQGAPQGEPQGEPAPHPPATPAWSGSGASPRLALRFPWIKLVSLTLLWGGFLGLSALDALLPLCSLQYLLYLLLFLVTTLGVTAMFIRAIFLAPAWAASSGSEAPRRKPWLRRHLLPAAAEDAEGSGGGGGSGAHQPLLDGPGSGGSGFVGGTPDPEGCDDASSSAEPASLSVVAALSAVVAAAAGVLAGVAGLGGGHMLGSALLDFRVHPQVATATSVVLLFISSTAATLSYVMEGRLIFSYAATFAACAAAGSLAGATLIGGAARRSGREAVLLLALAAAVGGGAALTLALGAWDVAADASRRGGVGGIGAVCR